MKLRVMAFALLALVGLVDTQRCSAGHTDIAPYFVGRTDPFDPYEAPLALKTGSYDLTGGSEAMLRPDDRVFMGTANNYAVGPGWVSTIDPGWGTPNFDEHPSEKYPAGTSHPYTTGSLSFNVLVDPQLGRNLSFWDGTGTPNFGPVPNGEALALQLFAGNVVLDGSATPLAGPVVKEDLFNTSIHVHWVQVLFANHPSLAYDPTDTVTEGFYLFSVNAQVNAFGTLVSEPLYILMAHGFEKYAYEVVYSDQQLREPRWLRDENGDLVLDEEFNWIAETDSEGNIIYDLVFDELGNPVYEVLQEIELIAPEMQLARNWVQNNLVNPVPEPASAFLAIVGAIGWMGYVYRSRGKVWS